MTGYPRGSEWRKWDLHLHAPGTKLSDAYGSPPDWPRFCEAIEASDIAAFGITDYFSLDSYFTFLSEFRARYPDSSKVFFPNVELRLNESVNRDFQSVDVHLLLRPDLDQQRADRRLQALKTQVVDTGTQRQLFCAELATKAQFESATVSRQDIDTAIRDVFGDGRLRRDNVMVVVPANNSGIRAVSVEKRKANLAANLDIWADAIFGSDSNTEHFLRTDRFEDGPKSTPKPVYSGCDAHSFTDIDEWLGKTVESRSTRQTVTWIKADVTFEGLQQTLVEPDERVRIQPTRPDHKDPYKYIARVRFSNTADSPSAISVNENLVSIIGSRSSGKSALLAYIAHSVDSEYTVAQQMATNLFAKPADAGPAAGMTWSDVAGLTCTVEWGDPQVTEGKVIYIPQNSLYAISRRPDDITQKIAPALYRLSERYRVAHDQVLRNWELANGAIGAAVDEWFRLRDEVERTSPRIRDLGDRKAIQATRASLAAEIECLRAEASLSAEDVRAFDDLAATFRDIDARVAGCDQESAQLSPYVQATSDGNWEITSNVQVAIQVRPLPTELSEVIGQDIATLVERSRGELLDRTAAVLLSRRKALAAERRALEELRAALSQEHQDLIARNTANAQLESLIQSHAVQVQTLGAIDKKGDELMRHRSEQAAQVRLIESQIETRALVTRPLVEAFDSEPDELEGMTFGFEERLEEETVEAISDRFNKQEKSTFINTDTKTLDVARVQREPGIFMEAVASRKQKLKQGVPVVAAASEALKATPAIRFYARLDGDRIGGFERSSMTPGKQALFALTLTLSESDEAWPLLIDQPEDDLDSRAIYDTIVPYLKQRKRERQILMVTHNANLVVGADSEQVVVTNRHGEDRKNRDARTFADLTGSLEHSRRPNASQYVLETGGIREHACQILDGGEEAFQKRRDKYKMY
ncbi:MAG TPA: hypothetical protein VF533_16875 [Solirubrobacteraceae bacterium]|jgi:hypothetical protein